MIKPYNLLTSTMQPSFFGSDGPLCDICIEKGFENTIKISRAGSEPENCFWLTDNDDDTDFVSTLSSDHSTVLADVVETSGSNFVLLGYTPRTLCVQEGNFVDGEAWWDWNDIAIETIANFKFFDFLTGNEIEGVDSGATAFITEIGTTCCDGNFVIAAYYASQIGTFIEGEKIRVNGIPLEDIQRAYATQSNRYSDVEGFFANVYQSAETPYFVQQDNCADTKECLTFRKVKGIPNLIKLDYSSFSREDVRTNGCSSDIVSKMTLKYSPEILCNYAGKIVCDWDSVALALVAGFPFYDFLTGQRIRGWHSGAEAIVSKIEVKRPAGSGRLIVVTLSSQTRDFFAEEPIEVLSMSQQEMLETWMTHYPTYNAIPGFYDALRTMLTKPYQTASNLENAFCAGQVDDIMTALKERTAVIVDGVPMDAEFSLIPSSWFLLTCRQRCVHYPDDAMLLQVRVPSASVGDSVRIKHSLSRYASNNGVAYDELMRVGILPEDMEGFAFLNDTEYSKTPVRVEVKNLRASNRVFTLDSILSEMMACEYPIFASFMRHYMQYSNARGTGKEYLLNADSYSDINQTPAVFLDTLAKDNIQPLECVPHLVKSRAFQKQFVDFWKQNSRPEAIDFIFDQVWGKDVCISDPCGKVFAASADECIVQEYLYVISAEQTICVQEMANLCAWEDSILMDLHWFAVEFLKDQIGETIKGEQSRATAFIEDVQTSIDKNGNRITQVCISRKVGSFLENEALEVVGKSLKDIAYAAYRKISTTGNPPSGFLDNLLRIESFWVNLGGIPDMFKIVGHSGTFKPFQRLWMQGNFYGCQNSPIVVTCVENGVPTFLENSFDSQGNFGFIEGQTIRLHRLNSAGESTGWVDVTYTVKDTEVNPIGWKSRNSFTDDIVVLNDNLMTSPSTFILTTQMSRNEYLDTYRNTLHEAGSFMYSEYPVQSVVRLKTKTVAVTVSIESL